MRKLLAIAALLAFPATAAAADWYRVRLTERAATYTDLDSVVRNGDEIDIWEYAVWFEPTDTGMIGAKTRMRANCRDRSYRLLQTTTYHRNGSTDSWPSTDATLRFAAPDTVIENLIRFQCGEPARSTRLGTITPEEDARRNAP